MLMLLGLSLLLIGLARPEATVGLPRIEGTVILAFDVSNSMRADDLEPSRLDAAKAAGRAFVENQPPAILIGVVAFSGGGLVVQSPTDDRQAVLATIDRLTPQGSTSLGDGIFTSLNALSDNPIALEPAEGERDSPSFKLEDFSSAVVILLTDGENTESPDPLEIAQLAADAGVRIYPVGIGRPEGAVLELDGFQIVTQLDETTLRQVADTTNGAYYHAADEEGLQEIYHNIDLQMTVRGEKMEITSLFAGGSLLVLLASGGLALAWFGRMP
jgi:Ca-activated chloride channel family protein